MVTTATALSYAYTPAANYLSVERIWKYATTHKGMKMHLVEENIDSGQRSDYTMCGLPKIRVPIFMECAMPQSIPKCQTCQKAVDATIHPYRERKPTT